MKEDYILSNKKFVVLYKFIYTVDYLFQKYDMILLNKI